MPDKDTQAFWGWRLSQVTGGATPLPGAAWKAARG